MKKQSVTITIKLSERARFLLAGTGLISYRTGRCLSYGNISLFINSLIEAKLSNKPLELEFRKYLIIQNGLKIERIMEESKALNDQIKAIRKELKTKNE